MRSNMVGVGVALFILGIVCGALVTWLFWPFNTAQPDVVEGYTTAVNQDGTAIGFTEEQGGEGTGYFIAGAAWRRNGLPWSDSLPTCLEPLTSGQQVRLGFVDVQPVDDAPGRTVVVWLECLD